MQAHDPSIKFLNKVSSYVEIYNEQIHDLLDPATPTCILREDLKRGGTFVQGATEHIMEDSRDAEKILEMGTRNRTTAETEMVRKTIQLLPYIMIRTKDHLGLILS